MKYLTQINSVKRRAKRVRAKLFGTAKNPRITVRRSNRYIFVQAVEDGLGKTLATVSSKSLFKSAKKAEKLNKTKTAELVGKELAELLVAKKIKSAVFDRGAYRFHGRVKAVAEGLRAQGVKV